MGVAHRDGLTKDHRSLKYALLDEEEEFLKGMAIIRYRYGSPLTFTEFRRIATKFAKM